MGDMKMIDEEVGKLINDKMSRFDSGLDDEFDEYEEKKEISEYEDIFENVLNTTINCNKSGLQVESIINSLVSGYFLIPGFQRRFVWTKNQISFLALSIIKDIPIPPLYLYIDKSTKKQVVLDGQQRVTAVFLYFMGLYFVSDKNRKKINFKDVYRLKSKMDEIDKEITSLNEKLVEMPNNVLAREIKKEVKMQQTERKKYAAELKEQYGLEESDFVIYDKSKNKINISINQFDENSRDFLYRKSFELAVVQCMDERPQKVYANIFKLLNSGGKMLGTQEIRNGIYWESDLYKRLFDINENKTWRKIYGEISTFSKDLEILLKALSLSHYTRIVEEKLVIEYDGTFSWVNIMESFSEKCLALNSNQVEMYTTKLEQFLNKIEMKDSRVKCKKAVFEAVFVAFSKLEALSNEDLKIDYAWMCSMENEEAFVKVLSNKTSVETRLTRAYELVKEKYYE